MEELRQCIDGVRFGLAAAGTAMEDRGEWDAVARLPLCEDGVVVDVALSRSGFQV